MTKGFTALVALILPLFLVISCAGGSGGVHSDENSSSTPVNHKEEVQYKQALIRCHKTGGTRIVKINGVLRCF